MTEISKATLNDISSLMQMGEAFFYEAGWHTLYEWDEKSASYALIELVNNPQAAVYIAKQDGEPIGMASALLYPLWYNHNITTFQEFFLYVKPIHRNGIGHKLKQKLEDEAKERGARTVVMGSVEDMPNLDTYYARFGYRPSEKSFIKRLV